MKRAVILCMCVAFPVFVGCGTDEGATTVTRVLDNGAVVIVQENHASEVVTAQVWVRDGALYESPAGRGAAFVLSGMVFDRTPKYPDGEIARSIEAVGGEIGASSTHDYTHYRITMPSERLELALDVLIEGLARASFDEKQLESRKRTAIQGLAWAYDQPIERAHWLCLGTALSDHPYGLPPQGGERTLSAITLEAVEEHYRTFYVGANVVAVIVGSFDAVETAERAAGVFGRLPEGEAATPRGSADSWTAEAERATVRADVRKAYQVVAFPAPSVDDPDNVVMDIILMVLERGRSSRLNCVLVEELDLVGSVSAGYVTRKHPSALFVWMELPPEKTGAAEEALLDICADLGEHGVDEAELAKAKTLMEAATLFERETSEGQAMYQGYWTSVSGVGFADEYLPALSRVTGDDVRRVARKYLSPDRHVTASVVPRWASRGPAGSGGVSP